MKPYSRTNMTEIEALILINQTIIMQALGSLTSDLMRIELNKAADVTIKEVDKYQQ